MEAGEASEERQNRAIGRARWTGSREGSGPLQIPRENRIAGVVSDRWIKRLESIVRPRFFAVSLVYSQAFPEQLLINIGGRLSEDAEGENVGETYKFNTLRKD
jgi:hypothetical protein